MSVMKQSAVINGEAYQLRGNIQATESPYSVLQQFYRAFNSADLKLMSANWLHDAGVTMSNPLGGIKHGWNEIEGIYQRIFSGPASVYVEFYDYQIEQSEHFFYAVGRERGYFQSGLTESGQRLDLAIRTSRLYQKVNVGWKQVHHHGSIDNPDLLKAYQQAVLN